jgi:hypothetical protein
MNTMVAPNVSGVASPAVSPIIDSLTAQARTILGSALGSQPLVSFQTGALGNFPYYFTDPNSLNFNSLTYNWINNALASNNPPIRQASGSLFTSSYLNVLSTVSYSLSKADQAKLNAAYSNAQNQQMALLNAWKAAYGSLPVPGKNQTAIDAVISIICSTWATPPTNLNAIQSSTNLHKLLNNAPASGQTLMPVLASYVDALGDSVTLANAQTMNNAYVADALDAVQNPAADNGAILLNDNSGKYFPAYTVSPALSDIINGLQSTNSIQLVMNVSMASDTEYSVSIQGGTSFRIPFADFFSIGVSGSASYFHDQIVKNASSVSVKMTFTGVTLVNYTPNAFNESTVMNWYSMDPILQAIKNQGQDVTGFRFSPEPGVNFGPTGSFGILQGVAISNYPSIQITVTTANYQSIQTTFQQTVSTSLSFLGIPLGGGSESTYSHSASSSSSNSTVTISFNPPPNLVAGTNANSMGWVLGVQTNYPATVSG